MRILLIAGILVIGLTGVVYFERSSTRADPTEDFEVLVTGTPGIRFNGAILVVNARGQSTTESHDGITPARYRARGAIVSVSFQKQQPGDDVLSIYIERGNDTVAKASTQAEYGVVAVATPK